ncbi:MAG TPA: hypothetical protein VFV51_15475, partial [Vicinamibacterales bacterium]|nr:hypothetical protein [Vicinamibacterales bacterium]
MFTLHLRAQKKRSSGRKYIPPPDRSYAFRKREAGSLLRGQRLQGSRRLEVGRNVGVGRQA